MPAEARTYTPQEAAMLTGLRLQRIQNAITERQLGRAFRKGPDGRRRLDLPAVLTLATAQRLGKVRVEPELLYRAFRKSGVPRVPLAVSDAVTIDAPRLLAPVVHRMELYDRARERIERNPAVMGGEPVIKGTRLPPRILLARIKGGDRAADILSEYPYLDAETLEAALLYAEANPPRGRPIKSDADGA
jgi:uncharacterized protein (DUF433 family)